MKKYAVEKWVFFSTATMSAIIIGRNGKARVKIYREKQTPFGKPKGEIVFMNYITVFSFQHSSRCNKQVCHCWAGREL